MQGSQCKIILQELTHTSIFINSGLKVGRAILNANSEVITIKLMKQALNLLVYSRDANNYVLINS